MAQSRGGSAVRRFMAALPGEIERKVLRRAARAGADVIADEARGNVRSRLVAGAIEIKVESEVGLVRAKIHVLDQWPRSVGIWLEYGTSPHYITVDDSQREGMTAARINRVGKAGTLVINGTPVGKTVHHPGAQAYPFLRPALDQREADALAAAQSYINSRVSRSGIIPGNDGDSE